MVCKAGEPSKLFRDWLFGLLFGVLNVPFFWLPIGEPTTLLSCKGELVALFIVKGELTTLLIVKGELATLFNAKGELLALVALLTGKGEFAILFIGSGGFDPIISILSVDDSEFIGLASMFLFDILDTNFKIDVVATGVVVAFDEMPVTSGELFWPLSLFFFFSFVFGVVVVGDALAAAFIEYI